MTSKSTKLYKNQLLAKEVYTIGPWKGERDKKFAGLKFETYVDFKFECLIDSFETSSPSSVQLNSKNAFFMSDVLFLFQFIFSFQIIKIFV